MRSFHSAAWGQGLSYRIFAGGATPPPWKRVRRFPCGLVAPWSNRRLTPPFHRGKEPRPVRQLFSLSILTDYFHALISPLLVLSVPTAGTLLALLVGLTCTPHTAQAHGFAGARFFPATLTTDDPFVADELSLPTLQTFHTPDSGGTREFDVSIDIAKTITPYLDIEVGIDEVNLFPHVRAPQDGFQ